MKREIRRGELLADVDLKPFTYWRMGGNAERFYWPKDLNDLQQFLQTLPEGEPVTWLGLGSNVLVRDGGIKGTVILTQGALNQCEMRDNGEIYAQVGLASAQLSRFAARQDRVGSEFLSGVPGSVGGALFMNAGCYGSETWEFVKAVQTLNRRGELKTRDKSEFEIGYRHIKGLTPDEWFVAGIFEFETGDGKVSLQKIKALLAKRAESQPTGKPCCGSVFRNPEGDFAGRLVESLGYKGTEHGGLKISEKHANFIINQGEATAAETEALISKIQQQVKAKFDIDLVPEVKVIGEKA